MNAIIIAYLAASTAIQNVACLSCYTCDSAANHNCYNFPASIHNNSTCSPTAKGCLKAVFDTTEFDIFDYLSEDADYRPTFETFRTIRKCYEKEYFAVPIQDCEEREMGFLTHLFCVCTSDFCNAAQRRASAPLLCSLAFVLQMFSVAS